MLPAEIDNWHMQRALELAALGRGFVEPNPMVGCVIAQGAEIIGEGWHRLFGGPHAEIEALAVAGGRARGATMYVTLEPCCHQGKTPPCTKAVIAAGIRRVVVAQRDPFSQVDGGGIAELAAAGIDIQVGVGQASARQLNAPYLKLLDTGRPWVIAKWAMSLDGKIATHAGDSRWISGEASRAIVHQLRGRVDAILVGSGTALADDPLLTARPSGPRVATRVVFDGRATLPVTSQLARTARETPLLIAVTSQADASACQQLTNAGCEVLRSSGTNHADRLGQLLDELGCRRMTNVLVEGGGGLLGLLFDTGLIDEVHAFIAPKLIGGELARSPLAGQGVARIADILPLMDMKVEQLDADLYMSGRVDHSVPSFK
ncbi:MAG: bifunctional diaminohydroxyphosphoribosylaminopyrimidine deaminase/5-amino-6-(5-phosphoribosylamino)uracil reductase RibD [Pirellulales bacterium]